MYRSGTSSVTVVTVVSRFNSMTACSLATSVEFWQRYKITQLQYNNILYISTDSINSRSTYKIQICNLRLTK